MPARVLVLGGSGMLGSMVLDVLSRNSALRVRATARDAALVEACGQRIEGVEWSLLDALRANNTALRDVLADARWVVNAIGLTKPCIHDDNAAEVDRAVRVNALFPHRLARAAKATGARVLQIATDCVYSGDKGSYCETDPHDAHDAYGKTKSLGEVPATVMRHLRCSIIGPEPKENKFLLAWFLGQQADGQVGGYTNHAWNGVTTLHFARLCEGIILHKPKLPRMQHVLPGDTVSKCELLGCFANAYGRIDVTITPTEADVVIDRTLATTDAKANTALWKAAGYASPPTIGRMVAELAEFDYRMADIT